MLYMGYVGFAVPFAFAVAAMLAGRLDAAGRVVAALDQRRLAVLTIGIALGSWWAYYELGWGGWWFWDPVENASFMPWLVGTALMHSLAVTEKRGAFKAWTVLLAIFAFSLSLLGTFLVRSGIIVSVHAFASDPTRGYFILGFLTVVIVGALLLYAWRAPSLDSAAGFRPLSRETFLLLNNILLVIAAALVFILTLAPLFYEIFGLGKISVGPPIYDLAFMIPMLPLIFLIGLGMHAAWRMQPVEGWLARFKWPVIFALALGVAVPAFFYGRWGLLVGIGVTAALWIMASSLVDPVRYWRREQGLARMPRSMIGMLIAHFGVGMFTLGVTVVTAYGVESDRALRVGDTIDVAGFTFEMRELRDVAGPNYIAREATVEVRNGGDYVGTVRPQKRQYQVQKSWMTEAGILPLWNKDLFVALGDPIGQDSWSVRVQYKPMIRFIWLGALVMALGGIVAASDRRYRVPAAASEPRKTGAIEAATS
jgi:cytochrome c-type biogenesis protein CcmF